MKIKAIVVAGLVAGVWINLSGMAVVYVALGAEYVDAMLAHVPEPTDAGMLLRHLASRFGFGLLAVLLYAVVRPRFGGRRSATTVAAAFLYLAGYVPLTLMLNEFGILVGWRLWVATLWGAAEVTIAVLLGSILYDRLAGRSATR